jgi:hypothetical protein
LHHHVGINRFAKIYIVLPGVGSLSGQQLESPEWVTWPITDQTPEIKSGTVAYFTS